MNGTGYGDEDPADLVVCDTLDEQMEAFKERFQALLDEAELFGFFGITVLGTYDPLNQKSWRCYVRAGNCYAVQGLMHEVLRELEGI